MYTQYEENELLGEGGEDGLGRGKTSPNHVIDVYICMYIYIYIHTYIHT